MSTLLTNVGNIISSLVNWLGNVASGLINNPIFQIMLAVVLLILMINLIIYMIREKEARELAISIDGNLDGLKHYRSLSEEEKEEYYTENGEIVNSIEEAEYYDNEDYFRF